MGVLVTLTGPSASGKSTIERELEDRNFQRLISFTTRPMRTGERDHVDYHFIDHSEAEKLIEQGQTLQHIEFNGNIYGTLLSDLDALQNTDDKAVIVVEPNGVNNIRDALKRNPDYGIRVMAVYVDVATEILYDRMWAREGEMSEKELGRRLDSLEDEIHFWPHLARYDFVVLNNNEHEMRTAVQALQVLASNSPS